MSRNANKSSADLMVELASSLNRESDRALAVLAVSYLDHLLEKLIDSELKLDSIPIARRFLFKASNASLASFSSKIEAAHQMQLLADDEQRDLHLIRKIRNEFAHELLGVTFHKASIADRCSELRVAMIGGVPQTAREQFVKASVRLMVEILTRSDNQ